jgi:hypothetical protein
MCSISLGSPLTLWFLLSLQEQQRKEVTEGRGSPIFVDMGDHMRAESDAQENQLVEKGMELGGEWLRGATPQQLAGLRRVLIQLKEMRMCRWENDTHTPMLYTIVSTYIDCAYDVQTTISTITSHLDHM